MSMIQPKSSLFTWFSGTKNRNIREEPPKLWHKGNSNLPGPIILPGQVRPQNLPALWNTFWIFNINLVLVNWAWSKKDRAFTWFSGPKKRNIREEPPKLGTKETQTCLAARSGHTNCQLYEMPHFWIFCINLVLQLWQKVWWNFFKDLPPVKM